MPEQIQAGFRRTKSNGFQLDKLSIFINCLNLYRPDARHEIFVQGFFAGDLSKGLYFTPIERFTTLPHKVKYSFKD